MDEIAAINGISKRTLYETFVDKTEVLLQCVYHVHDLFNTRFESYLQGGCCMEDILTFLQSEEGCSRVLQLKKFMKEIRKYYPDIFIQNASTFREPHERMMARLLRKAQDEGFVRSDIDVEEHAVIINRLGETAMIFDDEKMQEQARIHRMLLHTYLRGLATIEGIKTLERVSSKKNEKNKIG